MLLTWAPDCLRQAGLQVVETSGCNNRSHGQFPNSISGVWHHDASPPGDSPGALNWMISNWRSASANFWVNRQGVWYVVGVGVAWHTGSVLSGMPNNFAAFGVETDQTVNEVPSPAMLESTRRGFAALLKKMGRNAQSLHFHKTIATPVGRKQDPWFDSGSNTVANWPKELSRERANVQRYMDGGAVKPPVEPEKPPVVVVPPPVVDDSEDYMYYNVVRNREIDYAFCAPAGIFFKIESPDHYHFLKSAGMINVEHGKATPAEDNLLEFIKDECKKRAGSHRPDIFGQGDGVQSLNEVLAQTRNDVSAIKQKTDTISLQKA